MPDLIKACVVGGAAAFYLFVGYQWVKLGKEYKKNYDFLRNSDILTTDRTRMRAYVRRLQEESDVKKTGDLVAIVEGQISKKSAKKGAVIYKEYEYKGIYNTKNLVR